MLIVLTTAPSDEAEKLAEAIVTSGIAACVQVLPPMTSFYIWEGKLERESENLLLIKTLESRFGELEPFIIENHSYDVPEIVAVAADRVSDAYAAWLAAAVGQRD